MASAGVKMPAICAAAISPTEWPATTAGLTPSSAAQAMAEAGAVPETTVMIGDTHFDIDMGLAAGTRAIGVGWGYHAPAELVQAGAQVWLAEGMLHAKAGLVDGAGWIGSAPRRSTVASSA